MAALSTMLSERINMKHKVIIAAGIIVLLAGVAIASNAHNRHLAKVKTANANAAQIAKHNIDKTVARNNAINSEIVRLKSECQKGELYYNQVLASTPVKLQTKLVKPDCSIRVLQ